MRRMMILALFALCSLAAPALAQKISLVQAEESLTLRDQPSLRAKRVETLLRFQPVEIVERKTVDGKSWAQIKTIKVRKDNIRTGWVLSEYLSSSAFASVDTDKLNARRGPGTEYDVILYYRRHVPLQVLDVATTGWVKVRDVDGDMSWVHPKLIKLSPPYVMTDGNYKVFNVRTGIGTQFPVAFQAEKGYLMQVLEEKEGWVHVKDLEGDEGWISAKIVFGWRDPEYPKPE